MIRWISYLRLSTKWDIVFIVISFCSNQPYVYGDYSIFLAEIVSTTNENILTEYLLETEKTLVRAYVLNHYLDGFKGTVFRQTQFAEFFEHFMHTEDEKGVAID